MVLHDLIHSSRVHQVSFHPLKFMFYSFHVQLEFYLNHFSLIHFLSRSKQSGFIVYLILWAFDSRHSRRSSLLLECSRFFASSLEFLFHLIPFPFRLGPKISGRDLLLVEECCNAPDSMRQVSASYSPSLPCHLLACCILSCHHMHFISCHHVHFILHTCSFHASELFPRCPFCNPALLCPLAFPFLPLVVSGCYTFSEWTESCQAALV